MLQFAGNKKVKKLYENQQSLQQTHFYHEKLTELPKIVQRYFQFTLQEGQPLISSLDLEHEGFFRTSLDKPFEKIKGKQYFTCNKPGFVWIGKTKKFTAVDSFVNASGELKIYLFSIIPIIRFKGDKINHAELLRWLGESFWMPTNLLPGKYISWQPIDEYTAKLEMNYLQFYCYYIVHFHENGAVVKIQTERHKGEKLEKWEGTFHNYQKTENMMIPGRIKANWVIDGESKCYADFNVKRFNFVFTKETS
ncbi:MAG: DUF6544 family protein [Bacteroidota bacterium]